MSNKLPSSLIKKLERDPFFNISTRLPSKIPGLTPILLHPIKGFSIPQSTIAKNVPWCRHGLFLNENPKNSLDPSYHAGCYNKQAASPMFISHLIFELEMDKKPIKTLDLCAGSGDLTMLLSSVLHEDSLLICNEISKSKVGMLTNAISKWGYPNTVVTHNDPAAFSQIPNYFDLLLVHAPLFDSEAQKQILANSSDCLKSGGVLLFASTSISETENDDIIDWLINDHDFEPVNFQVPSEWNIEISTSKMHRAPGFRFDPISTKSEAYFICVLRKKGDLPPWNPRKVKYAKPMVLDSVLEKWVSKPEQFFHFSIEDKIGLFPKSWHDDFYMLKTMLTIKKSGLCVGKLDRNNELIPHHDLAWSLVKNPALAKVDLEKESAIAYLSKNQINLETEIQGWALACFQGHPLGWLKILADRTNNYYPKELGIQS